MPPKKQQTFYSIDDIPMFESLIEGSLESTQENYTTFKVAEHKPHVLNDAIIKRAVRLYNNQLEDADCFDRQIDYWRKNSLNPLQEKRVEALFKKNYEFRRLSVKILELLKEMSKGTINKILEMDEAELALKFLRGDIKPPF
jgi:hypothetical protein